MSQIKMITKTRFVPYPYIWRLENGERNEWHFIAIEHNGIVIRLTNFHQFIGIRKGTKSAYKLDNDQVRRVCNFLTYVIFEKAHEYKVDKITEIPFRAVQDYLMEFAKTQNKNEEFPSQQSVEKERSAICNFMANLGKKRSDFEEHYYVRRVLATEDIGQKKVMQKYKKTVFEYEIEAKYFKNINKNKLLRDMPTKAVKIILDNVRKYAPDLLFGVVLQITAGLREGEVVNVRRPGSVYYGGIKFQKIDGEFICFEIDLTQELVLRSDGKFTGKIKKERKQAVYPPFLPLVQKAYEFHKKLIPENQIEAYQPMFVNQSINRKTGKKMAISKQSYSNRIIKIMRENVLPELLISNDVELRSFGLLLNENNWGLHAFRHFFSIVLTLNGATLEELASWRGDSNINSSFVYLQNKGELMKKYKQANDKVAEGIMKEIMSGGFDEL